MSCKAGMVVTVVHSTPKLEEAWQKVKNFGVGSSVEIYKVEAEEAIVIFKSGNRSEKVKLPLLCLSCYTAHPIPTGAVWEGTNKELRLLPETPEDEAADLTVPSVAVGVAVGVPEQSAETEIPGQRICGTCGAMVSEVDTMCNVCGGIMPSARTEPLDSLGELEEPAPAESRSCPSCGAAVGPDAVECPICETPFEAIEEIEAEKPAAAAVVVAPLPVPKKSKEQKEPKEPKQRAPEPEPEPVPEPAEPEKVCPSCGAIVEQDATECLICETSFLPPEPEEPEAAAVFVAPLPVPKKSKEQKGPKEPKQRAPEPEPEPLPEPAESERVCPSCGAIVEQDATECLICETSFLPPEPAEAAAVAAVPVPVPEREGKEPPREEPPLPEPEITCAGCGAVLDAGAEECFICGAKLGEEPAAVPAAVPVILPKEEPVLPPEEAPPEEPAISEIEEPEIPPEELHMTAPPPQTETVCAGCGAVLDDGAEECFICGAKVGEEPTEIPDAAPEPVMARKAAPVPEPEEPVPDVPEPKAEEIIPGENEILCPSCSSIIPADSEKCPECWTDLALYAKCPSCGKLTPAGEETCRECFATISTAEADKAIEEELGLDTGPTFAEEIEITEELKEEMTFLETEEEQGKECLVCGAIFGPDDQLCPICGIAYGVVIEEPEVPETPWEHLEVGLVPTVHTCPSCGENVTGLEATEREVKESNWFYRGLVAIFVGIFFTSFSIYARGVSVENDSLGMNPPPTDVVLNLLGWILVLIGFMFWFMSWRLHGQKQECPSCGIETDPGMAVCINCGGQLTDEEEPAPGEDEVEEKLLPKEESVKDQYNLLTEKPLQYGMPSDDVPPEEVQDILPEEALQDAPPVEEPADFADQEIPEIPEDAAEEAPAVQPKAPEAKPEHFEHGEDLPIDHEEHKKCPGCGIFIDVNDTVCPICDTPLTQPEPEMPEPVKDAEIEVPSEEEELAGLDLAEPAPDIDNITVPKENGEQIECPSCGASLEPGTKACPVCEYPLV